VQVSSNTPSVLLYMSLGADTVHVARQRQVMRLSCRRGTARRSMSLKDFVAYGSCEKNAGLSVRLSEDVHKWRYVTRNTASFQQSSMH